MNILSLFDGISCGRLALIANGVKVDNYFTSEIDKKAIEISQKNFPDNIELGNVSHISESMIAEIQPVDVIFAGFPCQDISTAGKRAGLEGKRSGLFWEFHRLLKAVQKYNPKVSFLVENVGGMTAEDRTTISEVLGVEAIMVNSAFFGPQRRKRYYWTNIPQDNLPEQQSSKMLGDVLEHDVDASIYGLPERLREVYELLQDGEWWKHLPERNIERRIIETVRQKHKNPGGQTGFWRLYSKTEKAPTLLAQGLKQKMTRFVLRDFEGLVRYPTPTEFERLQGLPEGYTEGVADSHRYKMIGNGWNVPTIQWLIKHLK